MTAVACTTKDACEHGRAGLHLVMDPVWPGSRLARCRPRDQAIGLAGHCVPHPEGRRLRWVASLPKVRNGESACNQGMAANPATGRGPFFRLVLRLETAWSFRTRRVVTSVTSVGA